MNDLLALIGRYGGSVEFASDDRRFGPCTEHPEHPVPRAVAEVGSTDFVDQLYPCADCIALAIEKAQMAAEDAGDRNPRITVTVARPTARTAAQPVITVVAA